MIWLIIVISSLNYHWSKEILNVISWDVYGYYLYLPAIFKYGDINQYAFALEHFSKYPVSEDLYQLMEWNDRKAPIYTIGMAMIYLPFYLVADVIAHIIPGMEADGMSPIYQWAIILGSWIYCLVGLKYAHKILEILKVSVLSRIITLSIIFLGTNYFHYSAFENGMPHHFLFTLYLILIYSTIRWHQDHHLKYIIAGAICISILCLARPSELICLLIPAGYGIYNGLSWLIKWNKIKKHRSHLLTLMAIGLILVSIQVVFWKTSINEWIFNGYQGHHFDFLNPHIVEGLFSFRKGWFIYTPLCFLGIMGIPLVWKYDRRWMLPVTSFIIINVYLVLSWHIWWYASSYGMRALIQSYAILMIPMAYFIESMMKRTREKNIMILIAIVGILLNQFQDWQYRNKILLQDEMNALFYKKSFLKTDLDKTLRKYIDAPEYYQGSKSKSMLQQYIPESIDTILPGTFGYTHRIPSIILDTTMNVPWISGEAKIYMKGASFNTHQQARMVMAQKKEDVNIKWRGVRFQQMVDEGELLSLDYDFLVELPVSENEYIEVTIWNNGPDTIMMQELNVYEYR